MALFRRRRTPLPYSGGGWADEHARDIFTYELLTIRQLEQDAMIWQTPALAMTAQAFLLTVALDSGAADFARYATAILGIAVAVASMQLMAKHRQLYQIDGELLWKLEDALGIPRLSDRGFQYENGRLLQRTTRRGNETPHQSWWRRRRSYFVWQAALMLFLIVNVLAVLSVRGPLAAAL